MASCLDGLGWREILGTIAGDDNIFLATRNEEDPEAVAKKIRDLIQ